MFSTYVKKSHALTLVVLCLVLTAGLFLPGTVSAEGIAISGSFYRQHYRVVPGESVSTPDIYIVVFNNEDDEKLISLTTYSPPASKAELVPEKNEFRIPGRGREMVQVGLKVAADAVPGDYVIWVTASVVVEATGISITSGAQQQAQLSVFGEAGTAHITTVTYDGKLFPGEIHLFHRDGDLLTPAGFAAGGEMNIRLVPGEYMAQVLYQGHELAFERFSVKADETTELVITTRPISVVGFSAVPNYFKDTGDIAFAKIVYTIRNVYEPEVNVRGVMSVYLEGKLIEETEVFTLPLLSLDGFGGTTKYTPTEEWRDGLYEFRLRLYSQVNKLLIAESRKASFRLVRKQERLEAAIRTELNLNPPGGELVTTDGVVTLKSPQGVVLEPWLVVVETTTRVPDLPKGFVMGSSAVVIDATTETGVTVNQFTKTSQICLTYTDDDIQRAGGDMSLLNIGYYDDELNAWVVLETDVHPDSYQICAETDHLSLWMILIRTRGMPVIILVVIILGSVILAGITGLVIRRYRVLDPVGRALERWKPTGWVIGRLRKPWGYVSSPIRKVCGLCGRCMKQTARFLRLDRLWAPLVACCRGVWRWKIGILRRIFRRRKSEGDGQPREPGAPSGMEKGDSPEAPGTSATAEGNDQSKGQGTTG